MNLIQNHMKKLFVLLFILASFSVYAQKVQNLKTKEVFELGARVENYCSIVMQLKGTQMGFFVGTDDLGFFALVDDSRKEIEFKTIVAIMNYMHKYGWEYINNIGGTDGAAPQYYFRKQKN
jgi:hypothetical protein